MTKQKIFSELLLAESLTRWQSEVLARINSHTRNLTLDRSQTDDYRMVLTCKAEVDFDPDFLTHLSDVLDKYGILMTINFQRRHISFEE